ncbi:MAG: alkaline phosphatase D family protein [Sphingomonadaceae bacterium]|nr:alkaline phosphatase D family protein [Sphingomonadaceae bacterium]
MTVTINRRLLLRTGMFGLGALSVPGAARLLTGAGFTHDVASGEPSQNSVLLWTRYVSEGEPVLRAEIAEDEEFSRIVARGEAAARSAHDFTAKATVEGLAPGRWYFYRFVAPDGTVSAVGRTRTLPEGPVDDFTLAVVSCSNMRFGYFNAYAHAAQRRDIDLVIHTGDYFYEYGHDYYPGEDQALAGRDLMPTTETIALADYWLRYASYRADPDLAALHRNFPMIARWDDHEVANNSWAHGAENHQPDEGNYEMRKAAALRAYRDWMPVSDDPWDSYQIGDLATIFMPDTRVSGRSEQFTYGDILRQAGGDPAAALAAFRDGPWVDASRSMLGAEQEAWLGQGFAASRRAGTRWQILAQQVLVGRVDFPPALAETTPADASEAVRNIVAAAALASRAGLPFNLDAWDGYPAARERLLRSALDADANLVVLAGDTHNGWASNLVHQGANVGVEMGGHSVTSPGFEQVGGESAAPGVARAFVAENPTLPWMAAAGRGYLTVRLTLDEARGEWLFLDTVRERSTTIARRHSMAAAHGARAYSA